jgi:hypothetical protein
MKKIDITHEVREMHEEKLMLTALNEVKHELEDGLPVDLQEELDHLLSRSRPSITNQPSNVVSFAPTTIPSNLYTFGETELLAAAGSSLSDWFSQPMNFGGAGFVLDVRKVIGTDNEIDVYLRPNKTDALEMQESLGNYIGQSIQIIVANDKNRLLDAVLYVDDTGKAAEGSGKLLAQTKQTSIKGKISISIVIDHQDSN